MKKVHEGTKSQFQSKIIPIPDPLPVKGSTSDNFIGRLGKHVFFFPCLTKKINFLVLIITIFIFFPGLIFFPPGAVLLQQTDVLKTCYVPKLNAWYSRDEMEILGIKMFDLMIESIGAIGVTGLDRYFGFCIVKELQGAVSHLNNVRTIGVSIAFFNFLQFF